MKKIVAIILCTYIVSCKPKPVCCIIVDVTEDIQYKDLLNRDLLDQTKLFSYRFSDMKHYYLDSQNVKRIVTQRSDYPKEMFLFYDVDSTTVLRVFPYIDTYENGLRTLTDIIELNSVDSDTLVSEIEITNNSRVIKKVRYNNILVYDYNTSAERKFIVHK